MNAVNPLFPETSAELDDREENPPASPIAAEREADPESNQTESNQAESNQKPEADQTAAEPEAQAKPSPASLQYRYLMTEIGQQQIAFPLRWVSELILVEQSHLLTLPFYDPMVLGVLQYKGEVVPLVVAPLPSKAETAAAAQRMKTKRTLTAIRLNRSVGKLAGVGLMVDRVIERFASVSQAEFPSPVRIFQIEDIPPTIWHPR